MNFSGKAIICICVSQVKACPASSSSTQIKFDTFLGKFTRVLLSALLHDFASLINKNRSLSKKLNRIRPKTEPAGTLNK